MLATHKCHPDVVELLVQYRADIDRTISMEHVTGGKTLMRAVHLAVRRRVAQRRHLVGDGVVT